MSEPISFYVQAHIDRTGESLRQMRARSSNRVHHSMWDRMRKDLIKEFPKPATIRAIAETLSLTETTVLLAIGTTLGVSTSEPGWTCIPLPARAEELTEYQKRLVWDLAAEMIRVSRAANANQAVPPC